MTPRIGIIGAGQLGAYLCRAASDLGFATCVLAAGSSDVAVPCADDVLLGDSAERALLDEMTARCSHITFEHEAVPPASLDYLHRVASAQKTQIAPSSAVMRLLQNKALQKQWLVNQGFPTAPFHRFDSGLSLDAAETDLSAEYVVKSQTGGYDGLGVAVVRDGNWPGRFEKEPCIIETLVKDKRELAVLVARSTNGEKVAYPVFAMDFDSAGNILRQVICPAEIDDGVERAAIDLALRVIDRLNGVGVFAVEMFLTGSVLLVNEISPRVHNVGHLTIEANQTSQFEQHIRAISGMPLAPARQLHPAAAMNNLLYEPETTSLCLKHKQRKIQQTTLGPSNDVYVHWYGKSEPRQLRKMGHVTCVGENVGVVRQKADQALQQLASI